MQEEVENRTVNLAISTTKLTFRTIVNGYTIRQRRLRNQRRCRLESRASKN